MKNLGTQISEDGKTEWRNNGGLVERCFLYNDQGWENVALTPDCPKTAFELAKMCEQGGYDYKPPKRTAEELEEKREEAGVSMAKAARLSETPYRTWQNWENGSRRVPGWVFSWLEMYKNGGSNWP